MAAPPCREAFGGMGHTDLGINRASFRELEEPKAKLMRRILSGAIWTQSSLEHIKEVQHQCRWCHAERETIMHLWWDCPRFQGIRSKALERLEGLDAQRMPPSLLYAGIFPGPVLGQGTVAWGGECQEGVPDLLRWQPPSRDACVLLDKARALLGRPPGARIAPIEIETVVARMADTDELPIPGIRAGAAPAAINAYSDGGVSDPSKQGRTRVGAGLWVPDTGGQPGPAMHDAFFQFALDARREGGMPTGRV